MTTTELDALFGAEGGDFVDEEGTYLFEVSKADTTKSRGGDPMLKLNMTVVSRLDDPTNETQVGNLLIHRMTYVPTSVEGAKSILKRSLDALGITQEFAKAVAQGVPVSSQIAVLFTEAVKVLKSRRVIADVKAQGGDGEYKDRMQVQYSLKKVKDQATVAPPTETTVVVEDEAVSAPEIPVETPDEDDAPPF